MSFLVKEELFERFIQNLKFRFKRNPSDFQFFTESKNEIPYAYLEDFLFLNKIDFNNSGIAFNFEGIMPVRVIQDNDEGRLSSGINFIYPGTDKEIIFYFYQLSSEIHTLSNVIIGCKNTEVFDDFLKNLKEFYIEKSRSNNIIIVYNGRDIERPNLSWDEIIFPENLKEDIKYNIDNFINGEGLYRKLNIPYKRGFLLTGPPGNGKTMLLKVIASNYKSLKFIYFKFDNNSDNDDIDNVFRKAKYLAPSILCFEDLDSIFKGDITLSHFLNKLDGFEERDGTLILATTNYPDEIDPALTSRPSRFDRVWIINNPDYNSRKIFIERHFHCIHSKSFLESIASRTEGFSMAYMKELYITSSMLAIHKGLDLPAEEEITDAWKMLSSQMKVAKKRFEFNTETLGFGKANLSC